MGKWVKIRPDEARWGHSIFEYVSVFPERVSVPWLSCNFIAWYTWFTVCVLKPDTKIWPCGARFASSRLSLSIERLWGKEKGMKDLVFSHN